MEAAGVVVLGYAARGYAALAVPRLLSGPLSVMEQAQRQVSR